MKKAVFLILFISLFACSSDKLEISKAKIVAENLIKTIDQEQYSEISKFYTKNFNDSEPIEQRTQKFKELKIAKGALINYKLTDSVNEAKFAEDSRIILTYQIKFTNLTTSETFTIVKDEGEYRVSGHNIKSINK